MLEQLNIIIDSKIQLLLEKEKKVIPLPSFEIVGLWEKEKTEEGTEVIIEFIDPKNNKLGEFKQRLEVKQQHTRTRSIIRVASLGVRENGIHYFIVKARQGAKGEFKEVARIPLEVSISIKLNK